MVITVFTIHLSRTECFPNRRQPSLLPQFRSLFKAASYTQDLTIFSLCSTSFEPGTDVIGVPFVLIHFLATLLAHAIVPFVHLNFLFLCECPPLIELNNVKPLVGFKVI